LTSTDLLWRTQVAYFECYYYTPPEDGEGFYRGFTSGTESRIGFAILEGDELCEGKAEVQKSSC